MLPPMQFSYKAGSSERRSAVRYTPNSAVLRYYSADAVKQFSKRAKSVHCQKMAADIIPHRIPFANGKDRLQRPRSCTFEDRHIACRASLNTLAL